MKFFISILILIAVNVDKSSSQIVVTATCATLKYWFPPRVGCTLSMNNPNGLSVSVTTAHEAGGKSTDVRELKNVVGAKSKNLPPELCKTFPNTESLVLSNVNMEIVDDRALEACKNLNSLALSDNKLRTIGESALTYSQLVNLQLSYNQLTSLSPRLFRTQKGIVNFDLSNNKITSIPPNFFGSMTSIVNFKMDNNLIRNLHGASLHPLKSVTNFDMSYNSIEDLPDGFLSGITMVNVQFHSNKIKALRSATFIGGSTVNLSFQKNPIGQVDPKIIAKEIDTVNINVDGCFRDGSKRIGSGCSWW